MNLCINVSTGARPSIPPPMQDPQAMTRALLRIGYDQIDLVGLQPLRAILRDGQEIDAMPLRTDEDAAFLLEAYNRLPDTLAAPRPAEHLVYLWDGSFEIRATITSNGVFVRVGEFLIPFEPDQGQGVNLSEDAYRAVWERIAAALITAALE